MVTICTSRFNIQQLSVLPSVCVLCGSQNKQRLFPYTALTDCFYNRDLTLDRPVVTICTVQWSLYVPYSGHYMYRTVVTICTAQWSLYVPHSGHYMYRTVVTICTASLTFNNSTFCPHSVFMFCVDLRTNSDYYLIQH
jgi:hypothetical protein